MCLKRALDGLASLIAIPCSRILLDRLRPVSPKYVPLGQSATLHSTVYTPGTSTGALGPVRDNCFLSVLRTKKDVPMPMLLKAGRRDCKDGWSGKDRWCVICRRGGLVVGL